MKRTIAYSAGVFVLVLALHVSYSYWSNLQISKQWFQIDDTPFILHYLEQKDYFMGLSYALASAFTVFAITIFLQNRKSGMGGAIGGFTMTGILYFGGCFLLGCCGSPMLAVYLNLFGSSFLGFTKPLTFVLTLISIVIGYFWMKRRAKTATCYCSDKNCR